MTLLFTFLIEFEGAMNPLSLSKAKLKQRQRDTLLELDDLRNRLYLLEGRYHALSSIHNDNDMGDIEDTDTPTNQPIEANDDFRKKSGFKYQHEEIGKKIKRKFVTFKDQGRGENGYQDEGTNKDVDLPPPPTDWGKPSEYEQTGLLSVEAEVHEGAGDSHPEPMETTRPRLKFSRLPPPASPGSTSPAPGTPKRVKKPPPPAPPKM